MKGRKGDYDVDFEGNEVNCLEGNGAKDVDGDKSRLLLESDIWLSTDYHISRVMERRGRRRRARRPWRPWAGMSRQRRTKDRLQPR